MLIRICKIQYNRNTKSWVSMVLIQPWWKMSTIFGILCWTMNLWLQAYFKYTYSKNLCNSPNLGTQLKKICFFKKITLFCLRYCNICDCCFSLLFVCLFARLFGSFSILSVGTDVKELSRNALYLPSSLIYQNLPLHESSNTHSGSSSGILVDPPGHTARTLNRLMTVPFESSSSN